MPSTSFKSALSKPLRHLILFALIASAAFLFAAKLASGVVITGEIERLRGTYRAVGHIGPAIRNVSAGDYKSASIKDGYELIENDKRVRFVDHVQQVRAAADDFYTPMAGWRQHSEIVHRYFYGTLDGFYSSDAFSMGFYHSQRYRGISRKELMQYLFWGMRFDIEGGAGIMPFYTDFVGERYDCRPRKASILACFDYYPILTSEEQYAIMDGLKSGKTYLFRSALTNGLDAFEDASSAQYGALDTVREELIPLYGDTYFLPVEKDADGNWPIPPELAEDFAIAEENVRTLRVMALKDMSAATFAEELEYNMYKGRYIDYDDYLSGNKVCVISAETANWLKLKLGDKIHMTVRNIAGTFAGLITDDVSQAEWENAETIYDEYEIVGIFRQNRSTNDKTQIRMQINNVYIPLSTLPGEWNFNYPYSDYFDYDGYSNSSFALTSNAHKESFLNDYEKPLLEMGLMPVFIENGYESFEQATDVILLSAKIDAAVFGLLFAVIAYLSAFIYVLQHKREFAVMRALGVSKRKAARVMAMPMVVLTILGSAAGLVAAWFYAGSTAEQILSGVDGSAFEGITVGAYAVISAVTALLPLICLSAEVGRMRGKSALTLLQGGGR